MRIYATVVFLFLLFPFISHSQEDSAVLRVFEKVEKEAAYPGGEQGWRKFLEKNLNPNVPVDNGAPAGNYTVYVQFVVDKSGMVSDVKALTNHGYGMEAEVLRILKKFGGGGWGTSGAWEPATVNGRAVNAYRKQPVTFQVLDESFDISTYVITAGQDNKITIDAGKVKYENLKVTVSRGTITANGDGAFIVRVTGTERVTITITNGKKNKLIGTASLEVRSN
jgi:hypothetical protein